MHPRQGIRCRPSSFSWRINVIAVLAILALFCRASIPPGYMPVSSAGTVELAFCSSAGTVVYQLDIPGDPATPSSPHASNGLDCPFGMLASQAAIPGISFNAALTLPKATRATAPVVRQTLPPLPALGPPLGSRAPPVHFA